MSTEQEKTFVDFFKPNQRLIHKICKIYTNNPEDHQDLFQEITIQLWKSFSGFKGEAKFSTWMYRVALNTAIALFRKPQKKNMQTSEIDVSSLKMEYEDYEDDEHKLKKMYKAIYELSDVEKALIMLYLEDKPYKEIGDILGITEGNARVKMNRAKNNLKNKISTK
ncbi:RNA polymerase subunit sigma-70 [Chryseobacterium lactis]|uniref:RNA polymerase subunit sigma-70 n=1 Tax=Chryseobacterium lactis TaxID=1241981 RepID=A0A3G6RMM1_CHRLC|nr:sigma-70 family RNA polymerase sigma factor [Chryseobacterium lactis]AZA80506.1 sigma-70 family RNA polymerase sigma factor [Chryseobacterium lactis]AZB05508.1 sigma-70 family RNA polymerase sigma factor [Chryseobacterium lactis]PNW11357.1 RNA polymerase subunit sigma-70 [Chryseobacterium lactis]